MKKKGALLMSVTMVLVAALALTTASFAWFTNSMNPSLGSFNVNVTSSNALMVAVDKTDHTLAAGTLDFKTALTADELKAGTSNILGQKKIDGKDQELVDVTPKTVTNNKIVLEDNKIKFQALKSKDADVAAGGDIYDDVTLDDTKQQLPYLYYEVYFRSSFAESDDITVSLDLTTLNGQDYDGTSFYAVKADGTPMAEADGLAYHVPKTLRVAFVSQLVKKANGSQITGDEGNPTLAVFEPNKKTTRDDNSTALDTVPVDPAKAYTVEASSDKNGQSDSNLKLFDMKNGDVYKTCVYIWIEGNDAQCENKVSGGLFASRFLFAGTVKA